MKIIVTGGGGFVGRALVRALTPDHDVIAIDNYLKRGEGIAGDICDRATLDAAFANGCDAVLHLATVPGGAAEQDPALAKRVNLDATMALIDTAAAAGAAPRFIFASSIAVFGEPLPDHVDDDTPLAPRLLYGAHKAMMETWIATQTARGAVAGLSLRLPGIVARPKAPSGMKSAFMSDLFHALRAAEPITLPVSPQATLWLMSRRAIVANLVQALGSDATGSTTLPAVRTTMAALVGSVATATGSDPALVRYAPDDALEAAFGRQPPLATPRADALGFTPDDGLGALVASVLADIAEEADTL